MLYEFVKPNRDFQIFVYTLKIQIYELKGL